MENAVATSRDVSHLDMALEERDPVRFCFQNLEVKGLNERGINGIQFKRNNRTDHLVDFRMRSFFFLKVFIKGVCPFQAVFHFPKVPV